MARIRADRGPNATVSGVLSNGNLSDCGQNWAARTHLRWKTPSPALLSLRPGGGDLAVCETRHANADGASVSDIVENKEDRWQLACNRSGPMRWAETAFVGESISRFNIVAVSASNGGDG